MVRRGLKTTVIATVMAMMLAPSFSAFAQTGKSNTSGSWQVENNAWVFRNAEGQSVKGWVVYNQEWYYLNPENGQLKTGWLQLDGKWYFLSTESGAQQGRLLTGWQWIDGYCYYLMPTDDNNYGVLVVNGRTPDGYYVNQSGQWLNGENGDAVYEAGKGLPSAASSQQVAGASRALPGQVLGASRAIAAPGGGSFGGGGGGGSTGGGATASTTGGAGTATTGTATTGTSTAGTSTGTATGGSAAGTAGTAGESATVGGATGASTGTEANATTGAESNASGSTGETTGTTTPSTEKPGETVTPGTSENTTQPGGNTTETPGTENGGNTEKPGTENGGNTEKPGTENGGNTEKPVETETPGNSGTSENTNQPGGTTEKPGTENSGNTTEKPGETENSGNSENTTQPGGNTENSGTETGGTTTEKPGETETSGTSENTTQPGGTTEEKPGTENGGTTTEKPGETVTPGTSENTTQPGGTTEEKPGTENGGTTTEKPGETETPGNSENTTQPGGIPEETPGTLPENNLKDWPIAYHFEYDAEKKSFLLFFGKNENPALVKQFLYRNVDVMVNDSLYELGDWDEDLNIPENKYIYALKWDIKEKGYFNALRLNRAAFHEGVNTLEFAPDGYKPVIFNFNVTKRMLQDLKKLDKLQYHFEYKSVPGSYNVKIVKFEKLKQEQKQYLKSLKTLEVDGVSYTNVVDQRYEDLCAGGRHAFMVQKDSLDLAIGNPPQEYGVHRIILHSEDYEDIEISYEEEKAMSAPVMKKLVKKDAQGYYELSFQGDRKSVQNYLKSIKTLTVAGRTYGQMAPFSADLLKMGEKFSFGDSKGEKDLADLLLFSIPTDNGNKEQEIRIEAEGYKVAIIPLS